MAEVSHSSARHDDRVFQARATIRRILDDDVLIVDVETGEMLQINRSAMLVLDACDGQRSVAEVVAHLARRQPDSAAAIATDVRAAIEMFCIASFLDELT